MHRINGPGATPDNQFVARNPQAGIAPTEMTADWLNSVQEEISHAIEGAGITLDANSNAQLLAAILAIRGPGYRRVMKALPDTSYGVGNFTYDNTSGSAVNMGVERTEHGEALIMNYVDDGWWLKLSINVHVTTAASITIPTLWRDDAIHMYVDGTLVDGKSPISGLRDDMTWAATPGNHLVEFTITGINSGVVSAAIGPWIDGTNVTFVSTPAS